MVLVILSCNGACGTSLSWFLLVHVVMGTVSELAYVVIVIFRVDACCHGDVFRVNAC